MRSNRADPFSKASKFSNVIFLTIFLILCVAVFSFIRFFIMGTEVVTFKDGLVSCGTVRRSLDTLVVHGSREHFVKVAGKTYRRVRGSQPFYLRLPSSHSILFVTDVGDGVEEFNIVSDADGAEVKIPSKYSNFGNNIGSPYPSHEPYTEFVERENSREVVLASQYSHAKTRVFLDLQSKKVSKIEYDEFDPNGHSTLHHVYVNGKLVS